MPSVVSAPRPAARTFRGIRALAVLALTLGLLTLPRTADAATGPVIETVVGGFCSPSALAMGMDPASVSPDGQGGFFVTDATHSVVCGVTSTGASRLVAGNGAAGKYGDASAPYGDGGDARRASLYTPTGLTLDGAGNLLVVDRWNQRVRKIDRTTGVLSTVAGTGVAGAAGDGGAATSAQLNFPTGATVDGAGNLYIADNKNHRVRRVTPSGVITTLAGTGVAGPAGDGGAASAAQLNLPSDLAVRGNLLYIADSGNHRIRRIDLTTSVITTFAGNGTPAYAGDGGKPTSASLKNPLGVAVDNQGTVYIADSSNHRVRTVKNGTIKTLTGNGTAAFAGDGYSAGSAKVNYPANVSVDASRNVFIADQGNRRVRKITASTGRITSVAGNGTLGYSGDGGAGTAAQLNQPTAVAWTNDGRLLVADAHDNEVRALLPSGVVVAVAGRPGVSGFSGDGGAATQATLGFVSGVASDAAGNVYIADWNHRVRKVAATTGVITTIAGNGTAGAAGDGGNASGAQLNRPSGLAFDRAGNLLISDTGNQRVRRIDAVNGDVSATSPISTVAGNGLTAFAGDGGPAVLAALSSPVTVAVDAADNLYIADSGNQRVRRVDASGVITTVAGSGVIGYSPEGTVATSAALNFPRGVAIDSVGDLFIADAGNCLVRKVNAPGTSAARMTSIAGWTPLKGVTPVCGFASEGGSPLSGSAMLSSPSALTFDPTDRLYIADSLTHRVRRITRG